MDDLERVREEVKKYIPIFAKKISPIYYYLGWAWYEKDDKYKIPNEIEIIRSLNELLDGVDEKGRHETGGLYVEIEKNDDGSYSPEIGMIISEYSFGK